MTRFAISFIFLMMSIYQSNAQSLSEQPTPGAWPNRVFRWYYSAKGVPNWLNGEVSRDLFINAANRWKICGIDVQFMGDTDLLPGKLDGTNVAGWSNQISKNLRGLTVGKSSSNILIERDILVQSERTEFLYSRRLLEKVITHEFGHAIGLTHSSRCDDVMSLAANCPKIDPEILPINPTENDLSRCKSIYK